MLLLATAAASGHSEKSNDIIIELDPLPEALRGVTVSLHKTLTHQLVVENRTAQQLEVVATSGDAFLRIGPGGVEADLAAAEWYRTYTSIGAPMPRAARAADPASRWTKVSPRPTWGWFDLRLRTERLAVPPAVLHAARPATVGRWHIPVRLDRVPLQLTGSFRYIPPPTGYLSARLVGPSEISPGVRLHVLAGQQPGLFLENRSNQPVTILGSEGEPFLTVAPSGVRANVQSPSWHASGQADTSGTEGKGDATATPHWQERASVPRFSWLDPRLSYPHPQRSDVLGRDPRPRVVHRWEIAFRHGERRGKAGGVTEWLPVVSPEVREARSTTESEHVHMD